MSGNRMYSQKMSLFFKHKYMQDFLDLIAGYNNMRYWLYPHIQFQFFSISLLVISSETLCT
jgi:hypothetical protein